MEQSVETLSALPARMNEGWNAGDAAVFTADFATDVRLIEFNGQITQGRDAIAQAQQPVFDTLLKGSRMVNSEVLLAEIVQPGLGFIHHRASLLMAGETHPLPTRTSMQLFVVRWLEGRWQVVVLQNARVLSFEHAAVLDAQVSA